VTLVMSMAAFATELRPMTEAAPRRANLFFIALT
jgi:hypothetical protein